jgi:hypothetical protein
VAEIPGGTFDLDAIIDGAKSQPLPVTQTSIRDTLPVDDGAVGARLVHDRPGVAPLLQASVPT